MSLRRLLWCAALVSAGATIGCSDVAGPTPDKKLSPSAPARASFARYILISGVWTCVDGCDEVGGPEQKEQGVLESRPDSIEIPTETPEAEN
jgi:hypothetical protein